MLRRNNLTSRIFLYFFTFLFALTVFLGCSNNSKNELATAKSETNESEAFFEPQVEEGEEGDVAEREDWFIRQRAYPFGKIPDNARKRAWLSRPAEMEADGVMQAAQWQPIGPSATTPYFVNNWGLTSGRINTIAVSPSNPQLILIGAATGGIWRSTDGGGNFSPVSDNHVDLSVGSIAFSPSNPSIVYAGMGDKATNEYLGTGVLKSTNGGQTWTQISNSTFPGQGRITKVLVDPSNSNRVYVSQFSYRQNNVTQNPSGFWYSNDGGANWQVSLSGLATDMAIHPTQPNTIYAAFRALFDGQQFTPGGIFKSTNGGQNWAKIYEAPSGAFNIQIAVTPADPQRIYVLSGLSVNNTLEAKVEVSIDEGASWNLRNNEFDKGQIFYNCYIYAHPTNPDVIIVGTRDAWASNDAGESYFSLTNNFNLNGDYNPTQSSSHSDQHDIYISPTNPDIVYLANDGGLSRSTDNAKTFQSLNASLSLTMFTSIDLHPTDGSITYGGTQDNGSQRRTGNLSWQEFSLGDGGQTVIDALDPNIVFSTYTEHSITRHVDNCPPLNCKRVGDKNIFQNDRIAFYPPFVGNGVNSNLYFGTYRLWISTNRGDNWTAPGGVTDLTKGGNDLLSAIGVGKSNINTIYTGSANGKLSVSTDGGANWNDRTAGLPNRFIKSVIVNPTNSNVAYVTVSGYDSGHIFKTTNAGVGWTDISGNLPNVPTNTLLLDVNTPTILYAGTDVGVFRSATDGNNWETFNTGMPPIIISELDMQTSGLIQVATFGRGAYQMTVAQGCNYTISSASQNVGAAAGSGSFNITTAQSCQWQAASNANWITVNSSGSGNGTISFNYAANSTAQTRTGQISVGGQTFTLTQAGQQTPTCTYSINPTNRSFTASGGTGSFTVNAPNGCAWAITANSSFADQLLEGYAAKLSIFNSASFQIAPTATFPADTGTLGAIPDGAGDTPQKPGAPRDVKFTVSGISGSVTEVELSVTGTHTWIGDLEATLIAPNGTSHRLFGYTGATTSTTFADSSDFGGAYVFKDSATSIPSGGWWQEATARNADQALTAGSYRTTNSGGAGATDPMPATSMNAAFSGVANANGIWTLRVTDGVALDTGSITAANLMLKGSTTPPASWLSVTSGNSGSGNGSVNYSVLQYSGQTRTGTITISANNQTQAVHTVSQSTSAPGVNTRFDFDGDGKTDIGIYRPSKGEWWYLRSSDNTNRAFQFGASTDKIVPADYTGDGKTDFAFFRPSSGAWFILRSEDSSFYSFPFGGAGDIPAPADFDGDGKADPAVFRPSTATWYILKSTGGTRIEQFGVAEDIPQVADYDGDGKADLAVFRPTLSQWWISNSAGGVRGLQFGASGDKPVAADYTGDGKTDIAIWRPSNGNWFILRSENNSFYSFPFGASTDQPAPGDYDGDGKADAVVFRNSNLTWYLNQTSNGSAAIGFGANGDKPIASAYLP